jgi:hypothetical protein
MICGKTSRVRYHGADRHRKHQVPMMLGKAHDAWPSVGRCCWLVVFMQIGDRPENHRR